MACKPSQKSVKTQAEAPIESYKYSDKDVKMEKYISTLNLGINVALVDVEKQINAQLKDLIYEDNSMTDNGNDQFMCKIWKREDIILGHEANALTYKVPLKVWLNVGYKALGMTIEKETEFDFNVNFKSIFTIAPNWEVSSQSTLVNYEFVSTPKIKLGPVDIPITSLVKKGLDSQAPKILKALDDNLKQKLEIKKYVLQAWNMASQPYLLSDQYRTWLKVSPQELQMTPLLINNGSINTSVGIKAITETITGNKPTYNSISDIPNLKAIDKITNEFKVGILSEVSHAEAVKIAKDTIVGQTFEFQGGKYKIKIDDIDIYGNENQLIIKTDLSGSIDATIYFKGVPYFDETSRSIKLKNFDYDLKTKNILAKAASWLLAGKLASTMQKSMEIPVDDQINTIKAELGSYLAGKQLAKGISLHGKIDDIIPEQIYLTPTSIYARVMASGKINVAVKGL